MKIVSRWDENTIFWEGEAGSIGEAVIAALQARANLRGANLGGANLGDADLRGANLRDADLGGADLGGAENVRLPTGETWDDYLTVVVPALLTAGGKPLESFAEHFQCHSWDNCPMAHAFDGHNPDAVPILLRPRAEQFIQLFDAGQIPWPLPTKATPSPESIG